MREVDRRTRVTRLARGVDLSGSLSGEAIESVCEVVGEYVAAYEELGAGAVDAIATSAVRDASNGDAFIAELRERFAPRRAHPRRAKRRRCSPTGERPRRRTLPPRWS